MQIKLEYFSTIIISYYFEICINRLIKKRNYLELKSNFIGRVMASLYDSKFEHVDWREIIEEIIEEGT